MGASGVASRAAPDAKIVFVNRYFYPDQSATSQLLTDLATALADSGLNIHVICSRLGYDDATLRLNPRERHGAVVVHRVWTSRFGRRHLTGRAVDYATFYASSMLSMLRLLRRGDTVVAKTDPPLMSIPAMMAAKLKGAQLINWLQDIFPEVASSAGANPLPSALDSLVRRLRDRSLRVARSNVVLGERMHERVRHIGVRAENIQIIENWAERDPQPPKPVAQSALRSNLGVGDRFVVGYSGNLGRAHDYGTLLGAAQALQADERFLFLMIGGGIGMARLAKEVDRLGLTNFRFMPYQPRESLSDSLAAADVHWVSLLPAMEGLIVPSKFYGILAAARPVVFIGDPDGELARHIGRSRGGAVVQVGATMQLAKALSDLQEDRARCQRMGEWGYQYYCARFSAQRAFQEWVGVLTPQSRPADALPPAFSNR